MNYKKLAIIMIIFFSLGFTTFHQVQASETEQPLKFATFIKDQRNMLEEQQLPSRFSSKAAWVLPVAGKPFVFYQKTGVDVQLSFFDQGQEHILWKYHIMDLLGPAIPPILAEGLLNVNHTPDILFCYTEDHGIGQSAAVWEQYLLLFLDGEQQTAPPLLLSASDWSLVGSPPFEEGRYGRAASERKTLLLLLPATETTPCTFVLWSRLEVQAHPPTNTVHSVTYQIATYHLHEHTLNLISEESGTATSTARTLRALVETTRAQGGTPLLLDFNRRPTEYVLRDEDWFAWERCIDEIEP